MMYKAYAVRDNKANYFWQPQISVNDEVAKRGFAMMVNSSDMRSDIGFAPGDFDLYYIGDFDSDTGVITSVVPCVFVANGRTLLEVKE